MNKKEIIQILSDYSEYIDTHEDEDLYAIPTGRFESLADKILEFSASNESLSVRENEGEEKICHYIHHLDYLLDGHKCPKCGQSLEK
jgi:hypothetical protein